jgi:hypothetical protein
VDILALSVGAPDTSAPATEVSEGLLAAGARSAQPWASAGTAAGIDEALSRLDGRRLAIAADLAGLQLVVNRLLRAGLLANVETAVVMTPVPDYLARLGLPPSRAVQVSLAVFGTARPVGVIKDDSGGVCIDHAQVTPYPVSRADGTSEPTARSARTARTDRWWVRAVVDDGRLADGWARGLALHRTAPNELRATVRIGAVRRRTITGRSLQLACDPALVVQDGVPRERSRSKRTFWSEPDAWKLVLPTT